MKVFSKRIFSLFLTVILFTAYINAQDYTAFKGKTMGILPGTVCDDISRNILGATSVYYSDTSAAVEDIRKGRIDGFMIDLSVVKLVANYPGNENLASIEIPAEIFFAPMGAISSNQNVIDSFNIFLATVKADGTLADMQDRWINKITDLNIPMPEIPLTGKNGTLSIATDDAALPFCYLDSTGGELKGYSIELALRFAQYEEMDVEFIPMDFAALIPYVVSGKADLGIEAISITEERKEIVLFTDSIYDDQFGILTLKTNVNNSRIGGFAGWLKAGIERNLITDTRWKLIVDGLGVTLFISFTAQILGTAWACFICFLLTRKNQLLCQIGNLYCGLIYGLPMLVLLMITYYIIFASTSISNVFIAIAAFTLVEGAGIAQNLKDAIDTVDPVEIEAALSIGFPSFRAFTAITLPQALRRALPGYTRGFIELVKATAIVGFIAIQDLTRAGDIIRSRTFDAYFPVLLVALIYLVVTTICVQLLKLAVNRVNKGAAA